MKLQTFTIKDTLLALCFWTFTVGAAPIIITSPNAVLNSNASADYVQVNSGATLTISNCTLQIAQLGYITVQTGGKLVLNNCTITVQSSAATPNYWLGIQVFGSFSQAQTTTNQGVVEINNGTVIEKALVAINVGTRRYNDYTDIKPNNYYTQGGGIVIGRNATIRNCRYAVVFNPYYDGSVISSPNGNQSSFTGMNFYWDINADITLCTDGSGYSFKNLVELHQVHDVQFVGCTFGSYRQWKDWWGGAGTGNRLGRTATGRGFGIESIGSSFFVRSKGPCGSIGTTTCTECTGDPCKFEGLSVAIHVDGFKNDVPFYSGYPNNSITRHADITGALFLNNQYSIITYSLKPDAINLIGGFVSSSVVPNTDIKNYPVENVFVNRCTFKADDQIYNYHYKCIPKFIAISYSKNVEISDNTFDITTTQNAWRPGNGDTACFVTFSPYVYFKNCIEDVSLYRNSFHGKPYTDEHCERVFCFTSVAGINRYLDIKCNTYDWDTTLTYSAFGGTDALCWDMDFERDVDNGTATAGFWLKNQGSSTQDAGNKFSLRPYQPNPNYHQYHGGNKGSQYGSEMRNIEVPFDYYWDSTDQRKKPIYFSDTFITKKFKIYKTGNTATCAATAICKYYNPNTGNTANNGGGGTSANPYVLTASPNPGGGMTNIGITTQLGTVAINGTVTIRNAEGNQVAGYVITDNSGVYVNIQFDFSQQPPGFYYITYTDGNGNSVTIIFYKP